MERKLATVRLVKAITPIEGADLIEKVTIGDEHTSSWSVVCNKLHKVGDKVIYFEIDSFLPERDEFEFLRKSSFRVYNGKPGFRLRTIKLKKTLSQGLVLHDLFGFDIESMEVGTDLTELLGIEKYEVTYAPEVEAKGSFPHFIPKTDAERIQNISKESLEKMYRPDLPPLEDRHIDGFTVTEKLEGSSMTVYHKDGVFGVCSRNLELKEPSDDTLALGDKVKSMYAHAVHLGLHEKLPKHGNYAIQGEFIGPGIQGNIYILGTYQFRAFAIWDIDFQEYVKQWKLESMCDEIGVLTVPVLGTTVATDGMPGAAGDFEKFKTRMLEFANGASSLADTPREGVVLRSFRDPNIVIKAISNDYLLKQKD
jgi:RNA ligase (TIGR02306 family)